MMSPACQLCESTEPAVPFYADQGIVRCPRCALVFYQGSANPEALYSDEYFTGGEYQDYAADKAIIQRNFRARIPDLKRLAPSGSLLEIGSAYGFFLDVAKKHWQVKGVEITPEGVRYAQETLGLNVTRADFLDLPDEPESYDLICMWDTIEHLQQPIRYIEKAAKWLKPGGALVMTTGNIESLNSRLRGPKWRLIHPPTHLFYFSPGTLGKAAERAGLHVTGVKHVGYSRGTRAICFGLFMFGARKWPRLYRLFTLGNRLDMPIYLNLYDIMQLTAVKSADPGIT
jgi:cyclopropane fatty-acyl-phospholipid synthase-like methyltransferase